jgi:hypothetical protein
MEERKYSAQAWMARFISAVVGRSRLRAAHPREGIHSLFVTTPLSTFQAY